MFYVLFLTFELLFFNGNRNMKHDRKFHFAGIYLSKFILTLKLEKAQDFPGFFFLTFKLDIMIFEVYDTKFFGLL